MVACPALPKLLSHPAIAPIWTRCALRLRLDRDVRRGRAGLRSFPAGAQEVDDPLPVDLAERLERSARSSGIIVAMFRRCD